MIKRDCVFVFMASNFLITEKVEWEHNVTSFNFDESSRSKRDGIVTTTIHLKCFRVVWQKLFLMKWLLRLFFHSENIFFKQILDLYFV